MPRRPAKVTQADIARAIRAAKEAGASAVIVDAEGTIRISLTTNASGPQPADDTDPVWTPFEALRLHLKRTESG